MAFIKQESEDLRIAEVFSLKCEETEEQSVLMAIKEENEGLREMQEKDQYFLSVEKSIPHLVQKKKNPSYLTCHECGKCFTLQVNLKEHMKTHSREKPFTCQHCGKSFTQKGSLNEHVIIHTRERLFICDQCGKGFTKKGNLNKHVTVHTGGKAFACDECGKSFRYKETLRSHMRLHSGEKLFTCQPCGKTFTLKGNFNKHSKIHTAEKTRPPSRRRFRNTEALYATRELSGEHCFLCHQCGESFSCKVSLYTHVRLHTSEKAFTCELCGDSFSQNGNLKSHMKIHTGEKRLA